jgi:SAM-dependent methyltransferase
MISDNKFDHGKAFDFGRTSDDYGKYRDLYPEDFYAKILEQGLCRAGQDVLDLGTGTGVLPRNLYRFGANFTGTDISEPQIEQARKLSAEKNMDINYIVVSAEDVDFPDNSFDVITACQCFMYFNTDILVPKMVRMLRPGGRFAELFLAWLPDEDKIAAASEELVLKYNPGWTGARYPRSEIKTPDWSRGTFEVQSKINFDTPVHFTRETWAGRIRACRGIGASLPEDQILAFDREHSELLREIAPHEFDILHYASMLILKVIK